MRKRLIALGLVAAFSTLPATAAHADVSTTEHLPSAACNQGTMNAHESIPETTGTGATTPGHGAVPGTENVTPCGHGG